MHLLRGDFARQKPGAPMWIEQARQVSLKAAAKAVGLTVARNSLAPCPMCIAVTRGSSDKRGPIGFTRDGYGWMCHHCGAKGDVVDLISINTCGNLFRNINKDQQSTVRDWFSERGACPGSSGADYIKPTNKLLPKRDERQPEQHNERPPQDELQRLWAATLSIVDGLDLPPKFSNPLNDWMIRREFSPILCARLNLARVLPCPTDYTWPGWWPRSWAVDYRLVLPVYEMDGTFASIHGRTCADGAGKPKTRWPKGYRAGSLVMANRKAVKMMRGDPMDFGEDVPGLMVCEGFTDFLRATLTAMNEGLDLPIIAGTSGCFRQLKNLKIPKNLNIFIATDADKAGHEYAEIIAKQLADHPVYRMPMSGQET